MTAAAILTTLLLAAQKGTLAMPIDVTESVRISGGAVVRLLGVSDHAAAISWDRSGHIFPHYIAPDMFKGSPKGTLGSGAGVVSPMVSVTGRGVEPPSVWFYQGQGGNAYVLLEDSKWLGMKLEKGGKSVEASRLHHKKASKRRGTPKMVAGETASEGSQTWLTGMEYPVKGKRFDVLLGVTAVAWKEVAAMKPASGGWKEHGPMPAVEVREGRDAKASIELRLAKRLEDGKTARRLMVYDRRGKSMQPSGSMTPTDGKTSVYYFIGKRSEISRIAFETRPYTVLRFRDLAMAARP